MYWTSICKWWATVSRAILRLLPPPPLPRPPNSKPSALYSLSNYPLQLPRVLTPLLRSQAAAAGLQLVALDPRTGSDLDLQPQPGTVLRDGTAADAPAPAVAPGSVAVGQAEEVAPAGVAAADSAVAGSVAAGAGDMARLQPPLGLATPRMPLDVIVHKLHRDEGESHSGRVATNQTLGVG